MGECRFFIRGEIDVVNADGLATTLRSLASRHPGTEVIVDCMDLTFIDATGIGALITIRAELAEQGRDLWLVHPSPILARLLGILDLTYLVRAMPARKDARQSLDA